MKVFAISDKSFLKRKYLNINKKNLKKNYLINKYHLIDILQTNARIEISSRALMGLIKLRRKHLNG